MTASPIKAVPPPLRFLALLLCGWICIRAAMLFPGAGTGAVADAPRPAAPPMAAAPIARPPIEAIVRPPGPVRAAPRPYSLISEFPYKLDAGRPTVSAGQAPAPALSPSPAPSPAPALSLAPALSPSPAPLPAPALSPVSRRPTAPASPSALAVVARSRRERAETVRPPPPASAAGRWSGSAWALVRRDSGGAALAPGGTLGGSQAGGRILYRVGGGLALSGRAYAPLRRPRGAELAAGLDWRPAAAIPLAILAERRQAIGREGRSAFSITAHGGASRAFAGGLRLDAHAQAGIVGLKARDAFFDGAVRLSAPVGPFEIGGGAWGAAQPGAARLDAGPSLSYPLPVAGAHLRLQADWRLRIVGDAAPGSGPTLTLAADF